MTLLLGAAVAGLVAGAWGGFTRRGVAALVVPVTGLLAAGGAVMAARGDGVDAGLLVVVALVAGGVGAAVALVAAAVGAVAGIAARTALRGRSSDGA